MDHEKITVSKLEAARRQLDCAVEMWFAGADEVSVHTLVAASHQIIHDICQERGIKGELIFDSKMIRPEAKKLWFATVRKPMRFFKHADHDPEDTLEFPTFSNLFFMIGSIIGLHILGEERSWQLQVLEWWIVFNHPDWVSAEFIESVVKSLTIENVEGAKAIKREDFLEVLALAQSRRGLLARDEKLLIRRSVRQLL